MKIPAKSYLYQISLNIPVSNFLNYIEAKIGIFSGCAKHSRTRPNEKLHNLVRREEPCWNCTNKLYRFPSMPVNGPRHNCSSQRIAAILFFVILRLLRRCWPEIVSGTIRLYLRIVFLRFLWIVQLLEQARKRHHRRHSILKLQQHRYVFLST